MRENAQCAVDAKMEIDQLTQSFYGLFSNRGGVTPNLDLIFSLFIPQGIISKNSGQAPEVSNLHEFITPRRALLSGGMLVDFSEEETSESTFLFGNIAHRISAYRKSGRLNGEWFSTHGMKSLQFIRTPLGWRMSAVAWDDERQGLALDQACVFDNLARLAAGS